MFSVRCGGFIPVKYPVRRYAKSKQKKLDAILNLPLQKFNFSSRDPSNDTRAPHARMAQFWLKIAHLSFSMATTPLLKMILSYGIRSRLWLLIKYFKQQAFSDSVVLNSPGIYSATKRVFWPAIFCCLCSVEEKNKFSPLRP